MAAKRSKATEKNARDFSIDNNDDEDNDNDNTYAQVSVEDCPSSLPRDRYLVTYENSCYHLVLNHHREFTTAERECEAGGPHGHLAIIRDPATNHFLYDKLYNDLHYRGCPHYHPSVYNTSAHGRNDYANGDKDDNATGNYNNDDNATGNYNDDDNATGNYNNDNATGYYNDDNVTDNYNDDNATGNHNDDNATCNYNDNVTGNYNNDNATGNYNDDNATGNYNDNATGNYNNDNATGNYNNDNATGNYNDDNSTAYAQLSVEDCPSSLRRDRYLVTYGNSCYHLVLDHHREFTTAERECEAGGPHGHLAIIRDPATNHFLYYKLCGENYDRNQCPHYHDQCPHFHPSVYNTSACGRNNHTYGYNDDSATDTSTHNA
nr:hypothetical protein BaRGS_021663 [Batillaria attramentaria]